jgi:3-oxoacyl-[acyl-carrier-protein] synthase III
VNRGAIALAILGTGEYAPAHRMSSASLDERLGKTPGWSERHTGVAERGVAGADETVITMGAAASRRAVEKAGMSVSDLDAIIAVGSIPAQAIPCTAVLLQRELGLGNSGVAAFDINATCLGFLAALDVVSAAIHIGRFRRVLIVASEKPSCCLDWKDAGTSALFGDGAGAAVIGAAGPGRELLATHFQTFSEAADLCRVRAGGTLLHPAADLDAFLGGTTFEMSGPPLYRMAAQVMPGFLAQLLEQAGVTADGIDVWVPHQASGKGQQHMQAALGLPAQRFAHTLSTHGNQVAASLPVALHRSISSGQIQRGMTLALIGTGAGLSLGGAILRY